MIIADERYWHKWTLENLNMVQDKLVEAMNGLLDGSPANMFTAGVALESARAMLCTTTDELRSYRDET